MAGKNETHTYIYIAQIFLESCGFGTMIDNLISERKINAVICFREISVEKEKEGLLTISKVTE